MSVCDLVLVEFCGFEMETRGFFLDLWKEGSEEVTRGAREVERDRAFEGAWREGADMY